MEQTLFTETPADDGGAVPHVHVVPVVCDRCGCDRFVDVPLKPHNGRSTRRDCARCHRTLGFPLWYGQVQPVQ